MRVGISQLAAIAGQSELVNMLLSNGASPSVLRPSGELYYCTEFHGVQHLLDTHRQTRSRLIFDAVADKKGLARLENIFVVRYWIFLGLFCHFLCFCVYTFH